MGYKKINIIDIGEYNRDPNVYHKVDFNPFGRQSLTWVVWYFQLITVRKKLRLYESYGRTADEAKRGLERAIRCTGLLSRSSGLRNISKDTYLKLNRGKRKSHPKHSEVEV